MVKAQSLQLTAKMNRHTLLLVFIVMGMGMMLMSCDNRTVFSHYESTSVRGWERNDTLSFYLEPMQETNLYAEEIGVRITGDYPFKGLSLIVEQTILPSNATIIDTLSCNLVDDAGHAYGKGINHYQYLFPLTTLKLNKGESVYVAIRHCMKREILPGITDIGLTLSCKIPAGIQTKEDKQQESKAPQR